MPGVGNYVWSLWSCLRPILERTSFLVCCFTYSTSMSTSDYSATFVSSACLSLPSKFDIFKSLNASLCCIFSVHFLLKTEQSFRNPFAILFPPFYCFSLEGVKPRALFELMFSMSELDFCGLHLARFNYCVELLWDWVREGSFSALSWFV